ncbi:MAG: DUF4058 family protein [Chloroflexota bacterium]
MPSPFPGMDPYLEDRAIWPGIHLRLITYIADTIQLAVQPKYLARVGERIEIATAQSGYVPDVMVVEPTLQIPNSQVTPAELVADQPQIVTYLDEERSVPFIEIVYRQTGDVVTLIEVLSPGNKVGTEREKYIQKQNQILTTHANLVEIDLLGYGRSTVLARDVPISKPADWRYMISVSRSNRRNRLELYPIPLKVRLPRCLIPLRAADPDVVLDLPMLLNRCYDAGRYDLMIDYTQSPSVTLTKGEQAWVEVLLQNANLRPHGD